MTQPYLRLQQLGIVLPAVAAPAAAYAPWVRSGDLLFLSGHLAKRDGQVWVGQLGVTLDTAQDQQAARAVAIDLMGTLAAALGGRPGEGAPDGQAAEPGQQHGELHGTSPGHQPLLQPSGRAFRRRGRQTESA